MSGSNTCRNWVKMARRPSIQIVASSIHLSPGCDQQLIIIYVPRGDLRVRNRHRIKNTFCANWKPRRKAPI
uniref:Uncharacterized protein n=1 Tax=Globodera rostochiensis TaxID=31243 RepID=A0A914I4X9_GLORO